MPLASVANAAGGLPDALPAEAVASLALLGHRQGLTGEERRRVIMSGGVVMMHRIPMMGHLIALVMHGIAVTQLIPATIHLIALVMHGLAVMHLILLMTHLIVMMRAEG